MTHPSHRRFLALIAAGALLAPAASAQSAAEREFADAAELIRGFTGGGPDSIPNELLERARGIAIVPNVFRGGFILGARRGRGVLVVRMGDGSWSNPAFITLTGGSIGWQIGAESTDVVLIFANDNAVKNITTGKFTLGGEAMAVAGPLRKQASSTMTFRAEVYGYVQSRGLFAGAAFQGARLDVDDELNLRLYPRDSLARPLGPQSAETPQSARRFLLALDEALLSSSMPAAPIAPAGTRNANPAPASEARTFPLPD